MRFLQGNPRSSLTSSAAPVFQPISPQDPQVDQELLCSDLPAKLTPHGFQIPAATIRLPLPLVRGADPHFSQIYSPCNHVFGLDSLKLQLFYFLLKCSPNQFSKSFVSGNEASFIHFIFYNHSSRSTFRAISYNHLGG